MMSYIKTSAESKKTESGLGSRGTRKVRPQSGIPFTATFWRTLSEEELKINNDHKSAHWCWMMDEHGENLHKEAENTHQPPIKVRDGAPACSAGSGSSMRGVPQKTEWNPRGGAWKIQWKPPQSGSKVFSRLSTTEGSGRYMQRAQRGEKKKKGQPGTLSLASLLLRTGERKLFSRQAPSKAHWHQTGLLKKCYRDFLGYENRRCK